MHHMMAVTSSSRVFSHKLNVFPIASLDAFSVLQSRPHEIWSWLFGTTFGSADALTYNPTKVFLTFPFPKRWNTNPELEAAGRDYQDFRADLMLRHNQGLTKTYNRFHDPDETSHDILKLRELHAAMDRAVLDAYGWTDIPTGCEFLLDWEDNEDDDGGGRRKKPWRLRWPDEVRDEVLARLLALNAERAAEEEREGRMAQAVEKPQTRRGRRTRTTQPGDQGQLDLG